MRNNKIILNILIRLLLIICNSFLITLASKVVRNEYIFVVTNLIILITIQIILFIRYFIRLNADIKLFFDAISSNDSSLLFASKNNAMLISNYNYFLNKINNIIREKKNISAKWVRNFIQTSSLMFEDLFDIRKQ